MTPARELEPTMTTASNAQSRLGIVRIMLSAIRVGQRIHGGEMVRAAPRDKKIEMKIAQNVETRAICMVSRSASSVRSKILKSGGKN